MLTVVVWIFCLVVGFGIGLEPAPAETAQKRVALVIGNGDYANVPKLTNPTNDSAAIVTLLEVAGFDTVIRADDLDATRMRRALRDFSDVARDADIAVVFFAGHGIEVNGQNYLIPVDAALERDLDVEDETIALERVNQVLQQAKRLRLIILDACRDNPFLRTMKRTVTGRSIGRGLAKVEVASSDTLVAYAAKAGSTAADGTGSNSPYTTALIKHLTKPGLDVRLALGRVRDDVWDATGRKQEPFVYGSLGGAEQPLVPTLGKSARIEAQQTERPLPPPSTKSASLPSGAAETVRVCREVDGITSLSMLAVLEKQHAGTPIIDCISARMGELKAAEGKRAKLALLGQQLREEERKAAETEALRKAEAERKAAAAPKGWYEYFKSFNKSSQADADLKSASPPKEPEPSPEERVDWDLAEFLDTAEAYERHLHKWSSSPYRIKALKLIAERETEKDTELPGVELALKQTSKFISSGKLDFRKAFIDYEGSSSYSDANDFARQHAACKKDLAAVAAIRGAGRALAAYELVTMAFAGKVLNTLETTPICDRESPPPRGLLPRMDPQSFSTLFTSLAESAPTQLSNSPDVREFAKLLLAYKKRYDDRATPQNRKEIGTSDNAHEKLGDPVSDRECLNIAVIVRVGIASKSESADDKPQALQCFFWHQPHKYAYGFWHRRWLEGSSSLVEIALKRVANP